jgi:outer membrane lipoprotein
MKNLKWLSAVLFAVLFSSCSGLSRDVRKEVETTAPFDVLRQNAQEYVGKTVILGGYILEVRNLPQTTHLIVLQAPLDFQDRPRQRDQSQGRFIAVYDGFLDPAVYEEGRSITVAGPIIGREGVNVDGYSYPTIAIKPVEIHLWAKEERRGTYPYFHDPFYGPFFYDPFYPWPGTYRYPYFQRNPWTRRR